MLMLERFESPVEAMLSMLEGAQSELWTALPGIIDAFDPVAMTARIQPAMRVHVRSHDQNPPLPGATLDVFPFWWVQLPLLVDVPVCFPGGGGFSLTFPVTKGDEALVIFSSRCIDPWWQSGGIQNQVDLRMHDLSDGFAIVGVRSKPRVVTGGVSASTTQLRSDDGAVHVELASGQIVNIVAPGGVNITGPLNVNGATVFTGTVRANGHSIDETHLHSGVQGGPSNTGPVTP